MSITLVSVLSFPDFVQEHIDLVTGEYRLEPVVSHDLEDSSLFEVHVKEYLVYLFVLKVLNDFVAQIQKLLEYHLALMREYVLV